MLLSNSISVDFVRADEGGDGNHAGVRKQFGHFANAPDVLRAALVIKTKVFIQTKANVVTWKSNK